MSIVTNKTFEDQLDLLKEVIQKDQAIVVDVETNGLDSYSSHQICGVGVGEMDSMGLMQYYPIRHHQGENLEYRSYKKLIEVLNTVPNLIGYNIKFDLHFLENDGLEISDQKLIDVIVMVRLIEDSEIKELSLTDTGRRHYGDSAVQYDIDTKKELRSKKWNKDFSLASPEMLGEYCKKDVSLTARLYQDVLQQIEKTNQQQIFELECALTSVLFNVERQGISVDRQYAKKTQKSIVLRLEEVREEIYKLADKEFNISSTQQIGEMFNTLGIESPVKTPKGRDSWNELALVNINHPLAGLIRQYRTLEKLNSTYIEPYLESDIMHTSFCNWGTSTGRLSSRDPNLQNIPRNHFKLSTLPLDAELKSSIQQRIAAIVSSKGQTAIETLSDEVLQTWTFIGDESFDDSDKNQLAIRRLFVPRKNHTLVSFDYSQMEVRVFLSYFRNDTIDELLNRDDVDFHGEAAKLAFNVSEDEKDFKFYRQLAKAITFGTIYGIGNKKLSEQLGTTPKEAGAYKKRYFQGLEGSKDFFDKATEKVALRGWIKNRYGRRYVIPSQFAYKGVNYLVQGTSADLLSERMIEIDKYLADKKSHVLLQVHDEIICEIHDEELDILPMEIKKLLETNSLDIPLKVDMEVCSPSWATKKDFESVDTVSDLLESVDWDAVPIVDNEYIDWS
tara:strand:+ start:3566 stop:5584 length:2019 start_codon:yes stop_codon:yes gene_type:complete